MKAMRAIIWKELRENAKWAIFTALGITLFCLNAVWQETIHPSSDDHGLESTLLAWPMIVGPIFGIALGLLQIIPELKGDRWAFLVHRPATCGTLFTGKAVAGLFLFSLATGFPFAFICAWLAVPGHVAAPFIPSMALPGIQGILIGVLSYFAGMLTALRRACWYGSRIIGLVAVLPCLVVAISISHTWQAFLLDFIFIMVAAVAAHGSFVASGEYRPQSHLPRFMVAAMVFTGFLVAILLVITGTNITPDDPTGFVWRYYQINKDGEIYRLTQMRTANGQAPITDARTLDGQRISDWDAGLALEYPGKLHLATFLVGSPYGSFDDVEALSSQYDTVWYYVYKTGRFAAYSRQSRRLIGTLGPNGFSEQDTGVGFTETDAFFIVHAFERNAPTATYLAKGADGVYLVSPYNHRVTRVAAVDRFDHIRGICRLPDPISAVDAEPPVIFITEHQIHAVSLSGKALFTTPIAFDTRIYNEIEAAKALRGGHYFFWYHALGAPAGDPTKPEYIVETDANGREVARHALPPLHGSLGAESRQLQFIMSRTPPLVFVGVCAYITFRPYVQDDTSILSYREAMFQGFPLWRICGISCCIGFVCAILAYFIGLRCGWDWRGRLAWAFGIFWLGIPGLLMLLALDRWPARETCPVCGKKRVVTRETCEHCEAAWPEPQRNGTEIFESEAAA